MAYLLFVDESGQDHQESPYEVLAGAAVHDTQIWNLVCAIQDAEPRFFGMPISNDREELKARGLLKRKTFKLANQQTAIPEDERALLAAAALKDGAHVSGAQLTALGQARIAYVHHVLELCATHGVRFFASIVDPSALRPAGHGLRKDYAYLFERFFYFVEDQPAHERGFIVFDELDRSQAHLLVNQMSAYFRATEKGRMRSGRVVPEPLFVHSDLTTGIQIADLVAYIISWNVRVAHMTAERREEMDALGRAVLNLRYKATIDHADHPNGFTVWSFAVIDDLRPSRER